MSDDKKDNDQQEYKGLSRTASVFGQSFVDFFKGGAVGAVVGSIAGAVAHNKEVHESMPRVEHEAIAEMGKVKAYWHSAPRWAKAVGVSVVLGVLSAGVAGIVGAFRGFKKGDEAKEQFKEITGENKNIKEKLSDTQSRLASSEASMAEIRSAVAHQPEQQKSHVADLNAERAAQAAQISQAAI